jgi:hypothetical protein
MPLTITLVIVLTFSYQNVEVLFLEMPCIVSFGEMVKIPRLAPDRARGLTRLFCGPDSHQPQTFDLGNVMSVLFLK